jgi:diguanylate cyclase (GGDEF)-like protein
MSLSNSLPQLEQAFRTLQDNFKKSVAVLQNAEESVAILQEAVQSVIQAALTDDKAPPLKSALALQQTFSSASDESSFDVIIFGDLNRFKRLNDDFGHTVGDYAIGHVGAMIQKLFVENCQAQAFRKSGDEFVILIRREFLESFKTSAGDFAECKFEFEGREHKTAMSFGFVFRQGEIDFETLLDRADTACREAKRRGGGSYVEWTDEIKRESFLPSRRTSCLNCRTEIICDIPRQNSLQEIKLCPVCSTPVIS